MDQLLDIDELIGENKKQENTRLSLFEGILTQCHKLIQKNNKERIREMYYNIPSFVFGKPKYNVDVLRNYIVWHLKDNGLRVDVLDRYHLYISWKETDINLEKYMGRKTLIDNRHSSIYMLEAGEQIIRPTRETRNRFEMMKYRQERQKQIQSERQQRFDSQKTRLHGLQADPTGDGDGDGAYLQRPTGFREV
jgi:hypothetical protein